MIVGIGCDIVQVSRFAKDENFLLRFIKKYFSLKEIEELKIKNQFENLELLKLQVATRFAAKEAVSKALGTGFRDGIVLRDIEILHDNQGKPYVVLYGKALQQVIEISKRQDFSIHLTLANEKEYANAVAIIEKN